MDALLQLLQQLTEAAAPLAAAESLDEFKERGKAVCRGCKLSPQQLAGVRSALQGLCASHWQDFADDGVAMPDVAKTLNALMRYGEPAQAASAAVLYSWLLRAPAAPVHILLDTLTLTGCLQRVKECAFAAAAAGGRGGKASKAAAAKASQAAAAAAGDSDDDDDDDDDDEEARPSQAPARGAAHQAAASLDVALCLCVEALTNLASLVEQVPLRSSREVLQAALEGVMELLGCSKPLPTPPGAKALKLVTTGSISSAAYTLLAALFSPQHGCVASMAATLLPRLTPLIVGSGVPGLGKRSAADMAADRAAALACVVSAYRHNPGIQDAVAALARHVCLRAPDKADNRAAAIKAASELVVELPQAEQEQFVGFVFCLSRTNKIGLRTLSVGLANNLLMNLPEPFKQSTFAAAAAGATPAAAPAAAAADRDEYGAPAAPPAPPAAAGAAAPPAGMSPAPWSVVALAALLQRCSDKSAVVRGRALSDLAEVVDCFSALLAQDPASEQHQVAEAFVEGLCAAAALQLPQARRPAGGAGRQQGAQRRGRGARGAGDESEEDDGGADEPSEAGQQQPGGGGAAAGAAEGAMEDDEQAGAEQEEEQPGAARRGAAFVAFMPASSAADLAPVMALVHRRCGDAKAAVRRGGLQLLEALLVMRASWQGYPRQLPSAADLSLLEAATSDPLVSVRKAALVALSTLLELFPAEPRLCAAWVASALPLVRDVEASIQDSLAEWAAALLFDKLAAVGAARRKPGAAVGRKAAAAAAAAADDSSDDGEMDWAASEGAAVAPVGGSASAAVAAELAPLLAAVHLVGAAAGACLGKLCAAMAAKRKLKAAPVSRGLEAVIGSAQAGSHAALGAWVVLREVAAQEPSAPNWQFLQERWTAVKQRAAGQHAGGDAQAQQEAEAAGITDEAASLLLVISHTTAGFPRESAEGLATELLQHVLAFRLPPAAAGAHVTALFRLTEAPDGGKGAPRAASLGAPEAWSRRVYSAAQEVLRRYIDSRTEQQQPQQGAVMDHTACVAVFTVGQVALLRAAKPPSGLTLLLQALTAHQFLASAAGGLLQGTQAATQSQQVPADWPAMPATQGASHQQLLGAEGGATQAPLGATQAVSAAAAGGATPVPAAVQGHAWTALGKVCLVDEGLAKKVVPLFVQELGRSPFPVVRNNIMVALSDMLIQYTALVDAHMPRLAACIRDRHELVRRQALALLANLLMKDYVKWRGPLFHRFTLALVDPSPAVRALAEYLLRDVLAVKAPLLAYNHFVEALFVLNGCTAGLHGGRVGAHLASGGGDGAAGTDEQQAGAEGEEGQPAAAAPAQFTLKGKAHRASRDVIYGSLLRSMSPEHKFSSAAKLCGEVLAGVADGLLPLGECEEVLRDALVLMACKDIKVSASRLAAQEDEELPAGGAAAAVTGGGSASAAEAAAKARGKLVSALMKRHLVEQVVPVLVELRRLLAEVRHPLLAELMACFAGLLREYKGEVEDILVADKQLAREILHDIKQAELAKQQQQQLQQAAAGVLGCGEAAAAHEAAAGRRSPPPAGVLPGTPVAAEVLATAERQRRQQLQRLREQHGVPPPASAGSMPPPSPRLPAAAAATPAADGAMVRTPATAGGSSRVPAKTPAVASAAGRTPGTALALLRSAAKATCGSGAAAAAAAAAGLMASPAPVTVTKAGRKGGRARGGGAAAAGADDAENQAPHGAGAGTSRAARLLQQDAAGDGAPGGTTNILLPSPLQPTPQRQWNIPEHVATGEKQQQEQQMEMEDGPQAAAGKGRAGGRAGKARATRGKGAAATAAADADGGVDDGDALLSKVAAAVGGGARRGTRQARAAAAAAGGGDDGAAAAAAGGRKRRTKG